MQASVLNAGGIFRFQVSFRKHKRLRVGMRSVFGSVGPSAWLGSARWDGGLRVEAVAISSSSVCRSS